MARHASATEAMRDDNESVLAATRAIYYAAR
jgi:hypothetical protein